MSNDPFAELDKEIPPIFISTEDRRVKQTEGLISDSEPDDVSMSYRTLTDKEKEQMAAIKKMAQNLINYVRSVSPVGPELPHELQLAIDHAKASSMWAVSFVTSKKKAVMDESLTGIPNPEIQQHNV